MNWRFKVTTCVGALVAGACIFPAAGSNRAKGADVIYGNAYEQAPSPQGSSYGYTDEEEYADEYEYGEAETASGYNDSVWVPALDAGRQAQAEDTAANGGHFTGAIPELAEMQKKLDELQKSNDKLREDFEAEKKKNNKPTSLNDPFKMKISGLLNLDGTAISQDDASRDFLGETTNNVNARNLMIFLSGTGHGNMAYSVSFGLNNSFSIYNAYMRFKKTDYFGNLTVGQHFVESGMESCTVTNDRVFATLDEDCGMFRLNRRLGISAAYLTEDKKARAIFGAYVGPSIASTPNYIFDDDPGLVLSTRITRTPIMEIDDTGFAREIFQFGGSYFCFLPGDDNKLRLRNRGLMWISSNPYFFDGSIPLDGRYYSVTNVEAEYQKGEFAVTGEGYVCHVAKGGGNAYGTTVVGRYFLTPGVSRKFTADDARFTSVYMPEDTVLLNFKERTFGQHWGALEAVTKWEWTEANNLKKIKGARYGSSHAFVAGLNWFWNDQTVWAFDWEHSFACSNKKVATAAGGESVDHKNLEFDTFVAQLRFKF